MPERGGGGGGGAAAAAGGSVDTAGAEGSVAVVAPGVVVPAGEVVAVVDVFVDAGAAVGAVTAGDVALASGFCAGAATAGAGPGGAATGFAGAVRGASSRGPNSRSNNPRTVSIGEAPLPSCAPAPSLAGTPCAAHNAAPPKRKQAKAARAEAATARVAAATRRCHQRAIRRTTQQAKSQSTTTLPRRLQVPGHYMWSPHPSVT